METAGTPAHIGRFRIVRELGRGTEGRVYLAEDPGPGRRVAIKVVTLPDANLRARTGQLLREAQAIARFLHPHIVPVLEANAGDDGVTIVYEYTEGITLRNLIAHRGRLDVSYAARLTSRLLDAVAYAHENDIVHGNIKAANILIDKKDMPRIMDFGIAPLKEARAGGVAGDIPGAATDIFSLGLLFYEMLAGKSAFDADGETKGLLRIAFDPVAPPSARNEAVDKQIDAIVMRAIAKQPEDRYGSALEMKRELDAYLNEDEDLQGKEGTTKSHSTVDFLIRRMSRMKDFPTFSQNITEINQKTSTSRSSSVSASDLANVILRDYSLTSKLLKLVNSAFYGQLSGKITTVTRAVVVLGFERVRMTAIGLMLFDQLQNHSQIADLKDSAVASFMSGLIAGKLSQGISTGGIEESFICGMLHNLGKHLVILYFPEEYAAIQSRMVQKNLTEQGASLSVLGVAYEALAMEILRTWNFPPIIVKSLCRLPEGRVARPKSEGDILKVVSNCSNALCEIMRTTEGPARAEAFKAVAARYHDAIRHNERELSDLIAVAAAEMIRYADALKIDVRKSDLLNRVTQEMGAAAAAAQKAAGPGREATAAAGQAAAVPAGAPGAAGIAASEMENMLIEGIQEISNVLLGDAELNDVLYMILETMYRGFGFQRVVLCVMDARSGRMTARFAFGTDTPYILNHFSFKTATAGDAFNTAIEQNREFIVNDADDPAIRKSVPEWYYRVVGAPAFAVYPIVVRNKPIGIFYADKGRKGDLFTGNQSVYMKTLCNQAVLAIKQMR
jgi:serine/threonine protein kinase